MSCRPSQRWTSACDWETRARLRCREGRRDALEAGEVLLYPSVGSQTRHQVQQLLVRPLQTFTPISERRADSKYAALQQGRRFSVNSMVQLDPAFASNNAFGITFDGTATYAIPPFPASEHALPPPPPPYMEASPMTSTSGQVLTPVMVFTPLPLPFGAHHYPGFGEPFSPSQLGAFAYSPSAMHQPPSADPQSQYSQAQYSQTHSAPMEQHYIAASPHPSPPQPQFTPNATSQELVSPSSPSLPHHHGHPSTPPPANTPQDAFSTPPKQTIPTSSSASPPPPPGAPQKQRASPTKDQPKPCDVWTCFRPTFCELAPCGCRICREHLGSVIRGAVHETVAGDEASKSGRKKYFVCVACQAKSITSGPVRVDSPSPSSKIAAEAKEETLEKFKISYLHIQPAINATPPTPTPLAASFPNVNTAALPSAEQPEMPLAVPSQQQSLPIQQPFAPQSHLAPQPQPQLQPQLHQPQYQLPMPPPPPQGHFLPQPYAESSPSLRDLPPHQLQHFGIPPLPPRFDASPPQQRHQPLPQESPSFAEPAFGGSPSPRVHPDRRARSFSVPQPSSLPPRPRASPPRAATGANATRVDGASGRWTPGSSPKNSIRRLQQRSADFAVGVGAGGGGGAGSVASASMRWQDPRGPKTDPSEPYQLQKPLWPVIKVENVSRAIEAMTCSLEEAELMIFDARRRSLSRRRSRTWRPGFPRVVYRMRRMSSLRSTSFFIGKLLLTRRARISRLEANLSSLALFLCSRSGPPDVLYLTAILRWLRFRSPTTSSSPWIASNSATEPSGSSGRGAAS